MKKIAQVLLITMLVFSGIGVSAYQPDENNRYSITYNVGTENAGNMYGLAAIAGTGENLDITADNALVYVYQTNADKNGNVTFNSFGPIGPEPNDAGYVPSTVFIGGHGFETAQMIGVLEAATNLEEEKAVISGIVTDKASPSKPITVTVLAADGNVIGTTDTNGDGSFEISVPFGTYTVKFTKAGYCSYTYKTVPATNDVKLETIDITKLAGDIDGNGEVKLPDLAILLGDYNKTADKATNILSDLDGNGEIKLPDLAILLAGYNNTNIIE